MIEFLLGVVLGVALAVAYLWNERARRARRQPVRILARPGDLYRVVPGDTLWGLAQEAYSLSAGRAAGMRWADIYKANASLIEHDARLHGVWDPSDPGHWIFPGQLLLIPWVKGTVAR